MAGPSLSRIMNTSPDVLRGYESSRTIGRLNRAPEKAIGLPKDITSGLRDLIQNGIISIDLTNPRGTLHITPDSRLIPVSGSSSNGFCIVHFVYYSGGFRTFEIDLAHDAMTVARKPADPRSPGRLSYLSCLEHETTIPFLAHLIDGAKLHFIDTSSTVDPVSDELREMRSKFLAVLHNSTVLRSEM